MDIDTRYKKMGISKGKFKKIRYHLGVLREKYKEPEDIITAIAFPTGEMAGFSPVEIAFMLYLNGLRDGKYSIVEEKEPDSLIDTIV